MVSISLQHMIIISFTVIKDDEEFLQVKVLSLNLCSQV